MPKRRLAGLEKIEAILEEFKDATNPAVTLQVMLTFASAAKQEAQTVSEIAEKHGIHQSTASRHLLELSVKTRSKYESYGLLEPYIDAEDMRIRKYRLTRKGRDLVTRLIAILDGGN